MGHKETRSYLSFCSLIPAHYLLENIKYQLFSQASPPLVIKSFSITEQTILLLLHMEILWYTACIYLPTLTPAGQFLTLDWKMCRLAWYNFQKYVNSDPCKEWKPCVKWVNDNTFLAISDFVDKRFLDNFAFGRLRTSSEDFGHLRKTLDFFGNLRKW